jgi:hypothetical protein
LRIPSPHPSGEDKHVTSQAWVGKTALHQVSPPRRSPQDPALAGINPAAFSIARSREPSSLYLPGEDVLLAKNVRSIAPTSDTPRVEASMEGRHAC